MINSFPVSGEGSHLLTLLTLKIRHSIIDLSNAAQDIPREERQRDDSISLTKYQDFLFSSVLNYHR